MSIFPPRLKKEGGIRVIAPACSLASAFITSEIKEKATKTFEQLGFSVSFGKHVSE